MKFKNISDVPQLNLNVANILNKADVNGCVTFTSEIPGLYYAFDARNLIIISNTNYFSIKLERVQELVEELKWITEEAELQKRYKWL